jgi:hypothetical protein
VQTPTSQHHQTRPLPFSRLEPPNTLTTYGYRRRAADHDNEKPQPQRRYFDRLPFGQSVPLPATTPSRFAPRVDPRSASTPDHHHHTPVYHVRRLAPLPVLDVHTPQSAYTRARAQQDSTSFFSAADTRTNWGYREQPAPRCTSC